MFSLQEAKYPDNLNDIRQKEFSRTKDAVYMDHAGSTLYSNGQISEYTKDLTNNIYGNPHSGNPSSELTSDSVYQIRGMILKYFNTNNEQYEVIFTSGATAAIKLIGECFIWSRDESRLCYLEDNHTSVIGIRELVHKAGASSICLSLNKNGDGKANAFSLQNYHPIHVKHSKEKESTSTRASHLFAYPGQSNFSGCKYPLKWISDVKQNGIPNLDVEGTWYTLLDAAALVSTSALNLDEYHADFVCLSFYKMFGFPTGLGALLVNKNALAQLENKVYFGGGTADGYLATSNYYNPRKVLHSRLEDGSLPFLDILALRHGFEALSKITTSVQLVQTHTFSLIQRLYNKMKAMKHVNGNPLVHVYSYSNFQSTDTQGPIICFNLKYMDGSYIGFNHVLQLAASKNIHLRSGCFCNVGACSAMLNLNPDHLKKVYESGHVCGDHIDLIDGQPVGAVRLSLGYMSTYDDVNYFSSFLRESFLQVEERRLGSSKSNGVKHSLPQKIYLKKIFVYPVKSCRPMEVTSWNICETGLKYDRQWMVVGEYGVCWTLKRHHRMALIKTWIDLKASLLILSSDEFGSVQVPLETDEKENNLQRADICQSKVCGEKIEGFNCGSEVNNWLTKVIGKRAILIRKQSSTKRFRKSSEPSEQSLAQPLSLSNEAQYLMVSESTVEYLRQIMSKHNIREECLLVEDAEGPGKCDRHLDNDAIIARFRCNFLISGADAFTEESWDKVLLETAGGEEIELKCSGLCNRCSMVCVDHTTGERSIEPLRTIGTLPPPVKLEKTKQRRNQFGVYLCSNDNSSPIECGAWLSVLKNN